MAMKRIIIHWTAGGYMPSGIDLNAYHRLIDGDGRIHGGKHPIEANRGPGKLKSGTYAAHTLNGNTGSIGIAICAMAGAVERPFDAGRAPIKEEQLDALARLIVELCDSYNIPITRETVLTHAEVQPILGIMQKGKWDITWLPGMQKPGDAINVGDQLRERARAIRRVTPEPAKKPKPKPAAPVAPAPAGFWGWLKSIFKN